MRFGGLSRRQLLQGGAASFVGALTEAGNSAWAEEECKPFAGLKVPAVPEFDFDGSEARVGLRPHRDDGYKLEHEYLGGKHIVHNYGHSGAGITMSWGCAIGVVDEVKKLLDPHPELGAPAIAILGGGVMGLTAASALSKTYPKLKIRMYARESYRDTTSFVAGGQWAPSGVIPNNHDDFIMRLGKSLTKFKGQVGSTYGVSKRVNYTLKAEGGLQKAANAGLIPQPRCLTQLPFPKMVSKGYAYETYLIEPPIFLKRLHKEFIDKFGPAAFEKKTFAAPSDDDEISPDIAKLNENIIINCTGLGAGELFRDTDEMRGVKGHLLLLKPQPKLDYLFSGRDCIDWVQYMFPRSDGVVIGGTYQEHFKNDKKSAKVGEFMLRRMKDVFEGKWTCGNQEVADIEKLEK